MERSELVCIQADMTCLENRMQKMDTVVICARERTNAEWNLYKLTNLTDFASLLKDVRFDFVFVEGELIGELCRKSIQKFEKSVNFFTLKQSILPDQQHQGIVQSLPVHYVQHISLKHG